MSFAALKAKSFEEKDVENLASLLNLAHTNIEGLNGAKAIEYVRLMTWAKQTLMPKVKDHVLGEPKIHEPEQKSRAKK